MATGAGAASAVPVVVLCFGRRPFSRRSVFVGVEPVDCCECGGSSVGEMS